MVAKGKKVLTFRPGKDDYDAAELQKVAIGPSNSAARSLGPKRSLLALTVSRTVAPASSRKASERLQLVQPLR